MILSKDLDASDLMLLESCRGKGRSYLPIAWKREHEPQYERLVALERAGFAFFNQDEGGLIQLTAFGLEAIAKGEM